MGRIKTGAAATGARAGGEDLQPLQHATDGAAAASAAAANKKKADGSTEPWSPFETWRKLPKYQTYLKHRWHFMSPLHKQLGGSRLLRHSTLGELLILWPLYLAMLAACFLDTGGGSATIPVIAAFATVSHNSIWAYALGCPFERTLMYHKAAALISVVGGLYHGIKTGMDTSGFIGEVAMTALVLFSLEPIRRHLFELFYRSHWILFIIAIVGLLAHGAGGIMLGVAFWLVDLCTRVFMVNRNTREVTITRLPSDVVRLSWPKGTFNYRPGQYVFIAVPDLSYFEWHPFSISSSPYQEHVSVHIRVLGNWTRRLYDHTQSVKVLENGGRIRALVDGSYGDPALDLETDKYKVFLLVSGGIGITPMHSIANDLIEQASRGRQLVKVYFVWSVRDKFMIDSLCEFDPEFDRLQPARGRLPHSFSPDILSHINSKHSLDAIVTDPTILQAEFYLTKVRTEDETGWKTANIDPKMQSYVRFGRPNLETVFKNVRAIARNADLSDVAVLTCGPAGMVADVGRLCYELSDEECKYAFHAETFDF